MLHDTLIIFVIISSVGIQFNLAIEAKSLNRQIKITAKCTIHCIYSIVQYVSYVTCTDCESNIIPLTSHSSFVYVSIVACATMNGNLTVCNTLLITCGILKTASNIYGEVDEVREERLRQRRECDRLRRERETNEERQARLINLCRHLSLLSIHNLVMVLHIDWLGEERMMEQTCRAA